MLSDFNSRWSTPAIGGMLTYFVFLASCALLLGHMSLNQTLKSPPEIGGDAIDYDWIAWSLSTGNGFDRISPTEEFWDPYWNSPQMIPHLTAGGPATDRPPLYPMLLATTFRAGRQFQVIRIVQAVLMGMVIAAISKRVFDLAGLIPALLCPGFMLVVDPRPRIMVREILTEDVSCYLVVVLFFALLLWKNRHTYWSAAIVGGVLGGLILCRTMMVFWVPVLAVGMWVLGSRENRVRQAGQIVLCGLVAVTLCLPWWKRNVDVLGEFRPLGTQGAEQMSAAYSDQAFARKGMWGNLDEAGFFESIDEADPIKRSLVRAKLSEQTAIDWIKQHPFKSAILPVLRVIQEFRPHGPADLFVLAFSCLGLVIVWRTSDGKIAAWIIFAQVLAIAATWSVAGRFVYPLLGVMHLLAAIGAWGAYVAVVERRDLTRSWVLCDRSTASQPG